jgi:hypothetical protein
MAFDLERQTPSGIALEKKGGKITRMAKIKAYPIHLLFFS